MAKRKRGRPVNGILVVDKPAGLTSNSLLQKLKAIYFAAKAGHTGSLDPMATGVLPICFGEATKFSQFLLDADKGYCATIRLGITTSTGDADGDVVARCATIGIDQWQVESVLQRFRGETQQIPPMHSALKRNGTPLYRLARAGIEVEREARAVTISELSLLGFRPGDSAELDVRIRCSKGTYVRVLAEDIGRELACGGHVTRLRRDRAGPFTDAQAHRIDDLQLLYEQRDFARLDQMLLPAQCAVAHLPTLDLQESTLFYLSQGQPVMAPAAKQQGLVCLCGPDKRFIGVGEVRHDGRVAPRRIVSGA